MTRLPTAYGEFQAYGHADARGIEHLALVHGDLAGADEVLVRLHSECLTGDVIGSLRCDCGPQFQSALRAVVAAGRGVVIYLRGHEGRGIGLLPKLAAYDLQDGGQDTVEANLSLGHPVDARDYGAGVEILRRLGVRRVRLLTGNPAKAESLRAGGIDVVACEPLAVPQNPENARYLRTKRERLGHRISGG